MVVATGITKAFGDLVVLNAVDLRVEPGRVSVLIGPSGSGKTTLIRCMSLLTYPTSGTLQIDNDLFEFPLQHGAQVPRPWPALTVVFQQHFLWPHLTLRQNIVLPIRKRGQHRTVVERLIALFQMEDFVDRYPNQVSLGERQRAAIARAFALEPRYIFLDEITSALDVEQTGAVVRHLLSLRQHGVGMLVVTHLLEFARQLISKGEGDMIYFLDGGEIRASGGPEFFSAPPSDRLRRFLASTDYWATLPRESGEDCVADANHDEGRGV